MSIQAIAWVLEQETTSTGAARLVLIALANYADEHGECYPSVARLARNANLSKRATQYALDALVDAGLLERVRGGATDSRIAGNRRPNLYRLLGVHRLHPNDTQGCKPRHPGVQVTTSRGADVCTQTIKEPSENRGAERFAAAPPMPALRAALNGRTR